MAKVYKKACYRPVLKNATIETTADGKKYAMWSVQNESLSAELIETKNGPRIIQFSDVYIARYTDAGGKYIERSTGCKDRRAAEHVLNSWLQEVEKIKGGILTQENIDLGTKSRAGIDAFFDEYKEWHRSRGTTEKHLRNVMAQIEKVCKECKFKSASNLNAKDFSKWLAKRKLDGRLKPTDKLFRVPDGLSKILERDLKHAGIAKRDAVGRVIDVHALRYTHGTLLMRSNIDVLVTQKSLRHADVRMTSGIYTQRELDIVAEGVNRLPDFLGEADGNETETKPKE